MLLKSRVLLERASRWLLRNLRRPLEIEATIGRFAPGASALADALPELLGQAELDAAREHAAELVAGGVPAPLAERVARLETLVPTLDIVEIAASAGVEVASAAEVYFALGSRLELHWLRDRIVELPRETRWEAMARAALRDDVYAEQAALTAEVLQAGVDSWLAQNEAAVARCLQVLSDIRAVASPDLARLSVGVREIRNLIHSSGSPKAVEEPAAVREP
jgi:glutamate dehydrogenase